MSGDPQPQSHAQPDSDLRSPVFWVALALGWAVIGYGVIAVILEESAATSPTDLATWIIGSALIHDLVWAAVAAGLAFVTTRFLPRAVRSPVQVGLAFTALVLLVAWPLLRRYGARPETPSALPLDYGPTVVGLVIAIWSAVAIVVVSAGVRARRTSAGRATPPVPR